MGNKNQQVQFFMNLFFIGREEQSLKFSCFSNSMNTIVCLMNKHSVGHLEI